MTTLCPTISCIGRRGEVSKCGHSGRTGFGDIASLWRLSQVKHWESNISHSFITCSVLLTSYVSPNCSVTHFLNSSTAEPQQNNNTHTQIFIYWATVTAISLTYDPCLISCVKLIQASNHMTPCDIIKTTPNHHDKSELGRASFLPVAYDSMIIDYTQHSLLVKERARTYSSVYSTHPQRKCQL